MSWSYRGSNKVVVGITSRSSEKDLQWLMEYIRQTFSEIVFDVKYLPITNSNTLEWEKKVRSCAVGILYHTKRQGRINIVDVDGALYDEELEYLSDILGKSKVLVVLDDLENCSDSERERILGRQPSLKHRASQLLLFPEKDKSKEANQKIAEFLKVLGSNSSAVDPPTNTTKFKGSENFNNKDMKIVVDNRSELLRKDSSLQPKGSVSGNTKRYESTGPVPSAYSSSPSTNYYPNSNVDVQPSSSGVNHKERSLQDHTKNRSSDHSDEFEEPAHKKPFLKTNLAQTNIFKFASDTLEDLCTKGAPFLEIFNMINKRRLLFTQQINEIQKQMQEMEETIRMKEEKIKDQQRTISNRDNTIRLMRSDQELKECEIRKLPSKIEDNGIEGEKKEQKLQKQKLVIADLQTNIAEMKLEIQRLEERLQREDQKETEDKIHGQMNTMRQRGENIKSRSVSSMDPEKHPRMDEDSVTDQEEGSADSAHARQDKAGNSAKPGNSEPRGGESRSLRKN